VLTLAVAAVLVVLATALGLLVQATVVRAHAQVVADLSALAAARSAQGAAFVEPVRAQPCARATEVAAHNGGIVMRCELRGAGVVAVEAAVTAPIGTARASAVAGPRR
jgi:secretion/DNA translocation related TadE-like protein